MDKENELYGDKKVKLNCFCVRYSIGSYIISSKNSFLAGILLRKMDIGNLVSILTSYICNQVSSEKC